MSKIDPFILPQWYIRIIIVCLYPGKYLNINLSPCLDHQLDVKLRTPSLSMMFTPKFVMYNHIIFVIPKYFNLRKLTEIE